MPEPGDDIPKVVFKVNGAADWNQSIPSQTPVNSIIQVTKKSKYNILFLSKSRL